MTPAPAGVKLMVKSHSAPALRLLPQVLVTLDGTARTQERFAETSGFTQQYVSDLERGRRNPTVVTLFHLASALGATPAELLANTDSSEGD